MANSMWVDYNKIFSFNAFINMIVTERGIGKTYGASKAVVDDFLKAVPLYQPDFLSQRS